MTTIETIQVIVKQINGQVFKVSIKTNATKDQLIAATSTVTSYEASTIRLIYAGKDISDHEGKTVEEMGVENGSTMFVVMRLAGGKMEDKKSKGRM